MKAKKIEKALYESELGKTLWRIIRKTHHFFYYTIRSDEYVVKREYKRFFGYYPNLRHPQKLNEKLMWMKLYDREVWHSFYADKYVAREYLGKTFGEDYLVPLLFQTTNVKEVIPENISEFPCIVKSNHAMGQWQIVRNPDDVNWKSLQRECKYWLSQNWYNYSKEYQYKFIEPRIIVEKLLETKEGKIPNDYKCHFINGQFQFVYVSYDREGVNDRCIYDKDWNRLPFVWIESYKYKPTLNKTEVPRPATFDKMIKIGTEIAKKFPRYIRVDFYDVDGKLYFGEITFHHGGGYDSFFPEEYNDYYGKMLTL